MAGNGVAIDRVGGGLYNVWGDLYRAMISCTVLLIYNNGVITRYAPIGRAYLEGLIHKCALLLVAHTQRKKHDCRFLRTSTSGTYFTQDLLFTQKICI